jgi:PIN domain nuclease of toxin-antitoxin system
MAVRMELALVDVWLAAADETGFMHPPLTASEARASAHLPWHHDDPFDRIPVARAPEHGLWIATRDPPFPPYGVPMLTA